MSEETKKTTSHIRTFASDMEAERKKRGLIQGKDANSEEPVDKKQQKEKTPKKPVVTKLESQKAATGAGDVSHTPTQIPAFHEIKKQQPKPQEETKPAKKEPVHSKPEKKVMKRNLLLL